MLLVEGIEPVHKKTIPVHNRIQSSSTRLFSSGARAGPGVAYEFRLQAFNSLGPSAFSANSNPLSVQVCVTY